MRWLFILALALAVPVVVSSSDESVEFMLYDNGASTGGVLVTLRKEDFDAEAFPIDMSTRVSVSKYMADEPVIGDRAFREDGEQIEEFSQLQAQGDELRRVYLVAEDLEFVWPFVSLRHNQTISPRVLAHDHGEVFLESISDSPRVFRIWGLFTVDEGTALIDNALAIPVDDVNSLKRSTVGSSESGTNKAHKTNTRTSSNAWDHTSETAKHLISRSFDVVRIEESLGKKDGLQVVRYFPKEGYNQHNDYFEQDSDPDFNFDIYRSGSNRFATVFMYLNEVEEGGFTVFPRAPGIVPSRDPPPGALEMFEDGSWEQRMVSQCYDRLAVPPIAGTAALFYSALPDGRMDPRSEHGACPVTKGVKWGTNLWVWNKLRFGEPPGGSPERTGEPRDVIVNNQSGRTVHLSWQGRSSGVLHEAESTRMSTFEHHVFRAHFASLAEPHFDKFVVGAEKYQKWNILPEREDKDDL